MSSGMRLRTSIRPPTRYGEGVSPDNRASLLQSIRSSREQSNDEGTSDIGQRATTSRRRSVTVTICPKIVEYNPNLPPASFPTLNEPQPPSQNGSGQHDQSGHPGNANVDPVSPGGDGRNLLINGRHIENHIASNNLQNSTYAGTMRAMAGEQNIDPDTDSAYMTSDHEADGEGVSSSRLARLVAATLTNPTWKDLSPPLQVEIAMNLMHQQTINWWTACSKLGLTDEESTTLSTLVRNRNKAIEREDKLLEEMRHKQLKVITDLDHSEFKERKVPPEFVICKLARDQDACRSIAQSTYREIAKLRTTGMLNAKVSDVLTARQYLGRRGLPRSLAGTWGNGLVTMIDGQDDDDEPERFEWREDLRLKPHEVGDFMVHRTGDDTQPTKTQVIRTLGKDATVNPGNLLRGQVKHDPIRDFEDNIPWWLYLGRPLPLRVSEVQASFQWKLDKARREAKESRRVVEENQRRGERGSTETQVPETSQEAEGAVMDYDWNNHVLFQFVNIDGECVSTGVADSLDTRLFGDAI